MKVWYVNNLPYKNIAALQSDGKGLSGEKRAREVWLTWWFSNDLLDWAINWPSQGGIFNINSEILCLDARLLTGRRK